MFDIDDDGVDPGTNTPGGMQDIGSCGQWGVAMGFNRVVISKY